MPRRSLAPAAVRLALVLLLALCASPARGAVEDHLFEADRCSSCHLFAEREGTFLKASAMRRDVNTLCFACHEAERRGVGHRVGMVASMPVPEDFPLDGAGRVTCATCHDPHAVEGPYPALLRRAPGRAFCELCHAGGFSPGAQSLITVTFPPADAVLAPGRTVVAGTLAGASVREVTIRAGRSVVTAPVVAGAFAAPVSFEAGQKSVAVLAGAESALVPLSVRAGGIPWRPHLTSDTAQCAACHPGWRTAGFFAPAPPGETCYGCHPRLDRMPHTHRPAALGECSDCHDPHGGGTALVAGTGEGGPCLGCHDRDAAAPHIVGANAGLAVPTTACTGCHDPHQSTRPALTTSGAASLAVSLELAAPEPELDPLGDTLALSGFRLAEDPGRPRLPERIVAVAVPPGADAARARLRVVSADVVELPGTYDIPPAPPAAAWAGDRFLEEWGGAREMAAGRDRTVYGVDAAWPRAAVALERSAGLGEVGVVRVAYRPLQFNPRSGALTFTRRASVEVSFEAHKGHGAGGVAPRRSADAGAGAAALGIANAGRLASWRLGAVEAAAGETPLADYVIVTTRAIAGASAGLAGFVQHKAARGFAVRVVTDDDYGEASGPARAHAVRSWLQANRDALGIRYVLLIGDPHPETGDLPMLRGWPRRGATTNSQYADAPTDAYFADLTGNWDLDGDGYYGEFDGDGGDGGVDFVPEVFVGRIPVYGDVAALDGVLAKTAAYETSTGDLSWRRSALLPMSFSDPATDGAWLAERMREDYLAPRGFTPWTLYQQGSAGGGDSAFDSDEELRGGAAAARWSASPPGVVAWWGHGSATRTVVGFTGAWDGDILAAPVADLDDASPSFVWQTSCLNGYPELASNLAFSLLRRGAIATVSASRVSWYYVGQTSFAGSASNAGLGYGYLARLTAGETAGRALGLAKGDPGLAIGSAAMWMNLMDFNLYGDPAVGLFRGPMLQLSSEGISFTVAEGEEGAVTGGVALASGGAPVAFEALPEAGWLEGAPLAGTTPATLAVTARPAGLGLGEHAAQLLIVSEEAGNSPLAVPVTLRIVRPGSISGRVAGADGSPIVGATVTLQGPRSRAALTDESGAYGFATLPPGSYEVRVDGTGFTFRPAETAVVLGEGDDVRSDFLGGTLEIRGTTVRAGSGRPVGRVTVKLFTTSGVLVRRTRSRADGAYALRRLPPGTYRLRAKSEKLRFPGLRVRLLEQPLAGLDLRGRR